MNVIPRNWIEVSERTLYHSVYTTRVFGNVFILLNSITYKAFIQYWICMHPIQRFVFLNIVYDYSFSSPRIHFSEGNSIKTWYASFFLAFYDRWKSNGYSACISLIFINYGPRPCRIHTECCTPLRAAHIVSVSCLFSLLIKLQCLRNLPATA